MAGEICIVFIYYLYISYSLIQHNGEHIIALYRYSIFLHIFFASVIKQHKIRHKNMSLNVTAVWEVYIG